MIKLSEVDKVTRLCQKRYYLFRFSFHSTLVHFYRGLDFNWKLDIFFYVGKLKLLPMNKELMLGFLNRIL